MPATISAGKRKRAIDLWRNGIGFQEIASELARADQLRLSPQHSTRKKRRSARYQKAEKFYVIGFVPIDIVNLKEDIWSRKLDLERINAVEEYLSKPKRF
ncbi:hypothetical protein MUP77_12740 [Candidatus Bathyarchaeota archaeon]|nr:hypothetical protein [Candidatus Bathyarchaeota archaeon]